MTENPGYLYLVAKVDDGTFEGFVCPIMDTFRTDADRDALLKKLDASLVKIAGSCGEDAMEMFSAEFAELDKEQVAAYGAIKKIVDEHEDTRIDHTRQGPFGFTIPVVDIELLEDHEAEFDEAVAGSTNEVALDE